MSKVKFLFILFFIACSSNHSRLDSENIVLFKTKNYIIYSSKQDFSETLKSWMNDFPLAEKDNTSLYNLFTLNENQKNLDFYKIASSKFDDSLRLNILTADLLKNKKAIVYNIDKNKNEKVRVDSTRTNYLFVVRNDTIFNSVFKVFVISESQE